jgi:aminoglycoside/choline kinase family phosphotransferase
MASLKIERLLSDLFETWCGEDPDMVLPLAPSASARIYYRLQSKNHTAVGAYNADRKENEAFLGFSKHFKSKDLPVPEIYAEDLDNGVYLQEDLGFTTLI